jgi:hypothetical protein
MEETMRAIIPVALATLYPVLSVMTSPAVAAVYRCIQDGGHVSYQQIACSGDSEPLVIRQQSFGGTPLRPGERALLEAGKQGGQAAPDRHRQRAAEQARIAVDCQQTREQLAAVRLRLRRGYTLQESAALHQQQDDHVNHLRRSCY